MVDIVGYFPATLAVDSVTGMRLKNAEAQVFAMTDTSFTSPLAITDVSDVPLTGNLIKSNADGIYPEFKTPPGISQVIVKSGAALTPMTSIAAQASSAVNAANAAQVAAEAAAASAAEAAAAAGTTVGYIDNGNGTITLTNGSYTDNGDGTITLGG